MSRGIAKERVSNFYMQIDMFVNKSIDSLALIHSEVRYDLDLEEAERLIDCIQQSIVREGICASAPHHRRRYLHLP